MDPHRETPHGPFVESGTSEKTPNGGHVDSVPFFLLGASSMMNSIYRLLCEEALAEAGFEREVSPEMREVLLAVADDLYVEKVVEWTGSRRHLASRAAKRNRPSVAV
jgi:hypothetical protein